MAQNFGDIINSVLDSTAPTTKMKGPAPIKKGLKNAKHKRKAGKNNGGRRPQPAVRSEDGDTTESGY